MSTLQIPRRGMMTMRSGGGEEYFIEPSTGCIYPKIIDQTLVGFSVYNYGSRRWAGCQELQEATIRGLTRVQGGQNNNLFSGCPKLKKVILPDINYANTYVFSGCKALEQVQLGSVGHPVTDLEGSYLFSGCTQSGLTITVFVNASTIAEIPSTVLSNAPWGATNATVVYRSSTTGEVLT